MKDWLIKICIVTTLLLFEIGAVIRIVSITGTLYSYFLAASIIVASIGAAVFILTLKL